MRARPSKDRSARAYQGGAVAAAEMAILAALGTVLVLILWSFDRAALSAERDAARSEIDALESAREAQELAWMQRQEQDRYDLQVCQQQWADQSARAADALQQAQRETQDARERLARFMAGAEKAGGPATACGAAALELARACEGLEGY